MHRKLPALPLLLALCLALSAPLRAQEEPQTAADGRIEAQLDALQYEYEVDGDNDFKLAFEVGDSDRSQVVYIRSSVESYGKHEVREIWSPGYVSATEQFPALIANRLLEASSDAKLGSWVKQGKNAMFVVKIAAEASKEDLDDAIEAAITLADEMETELTPGKDDL